MPCALGTQTAGSVIRPAAFNGVVGFKPSHGTFPLEGVLPLAPSLDTLGLFSRDIADCFRLGAALTEGRRFFGVPIVDNPRVAFVRTPYWESASAPCRTAIEAFANRLRDGGLGVFELDAPAFTGLAERQNELLGWEARHTLGPIVERDPEKTRPETRALLAEADKLDASVLNGVRSARERAEAWLREDVFSRADAILTPAAPGEAPRGLEATGDPLFNRIWTLLGLPCVSLPIAWGPGGLPLAAQLVGPRGRDEALLAVARRAQASADFVIRKPPGPGGNQEHTS